MTEERILRVEREVQVLRRMVLAMQEQLQANGVFTPLMPASASTEPQQTEVQAIVEEYPCLSDEDAEYIRAMAGPAAHY